MLNELLFAPENIFHYKNCTCRYDTDKFFFDKSLPSCKIKQEIIFYSKKFHEDSSIESTAW